MSSIEYFLDNSEIPIQKILKLDTKDYKLLIEYVIRYNFSQDKKIELRKQIDDILKKVDVKIDNISFIIDNKNFPSDKISKLSKDDLKILEDNMIKYSFKEGNMNILIKEINNILQKVDLNLNDILQIYHNKHNIIDKKHSIRCKHRVNSKKHKISSKKSKKYNLDNNISNIILLLLSLYFIYFFFMKKNKYNANDNIKSNTLLFF